MGNKRRLVSVLFTIIVLSILPTFSKGINTSPTTSLSEEIPIDITIKLWGFGSNYNSLRNGLIDRLPVEARFESFNPNNGEIDTYSLLTANYWRQLQSTLTFDIPLSAPNFNYYSVNNAMTNFTENSSFTSTTEFYTNQSGSLVSVTGLEFNLEDFTNSLVQFNEEYGYTVHIMNFEFIDSLLNNSGNTHWFTLGDLSTSESSHDMRNFGVVGKSGLFYDPTGFAPLYENESYYAINTELNSLISFLEPRILNFVEKVIMGSPLGINYYAYPEKIHFANIVLYDGSFSNQEKRNVQDIFSSPSSSINNSAQTLLSGHQLSYSRKFIDLAEFDLLLFPSFPSPTDGKTYLTSTFVERLKNTIRDHYYRDYPYGYFMLVLTFLDVNERQFVTVNDKGEEFNYTHQFLGFGLNTYQNFTVSNLNDFKELNPNTKILHRLGQMVGMTELDGLSAQIPSPMTNGPTLKYTDYEFSTLEVDSYAKRVSEFYRSSTIEEMKSYRSQIKNSIWRWMDTSSFDDAELTILKGDVEYGLGNYPEAASIYLKGYNEWVDSRNSTNLKIIMIVNGFYLILFILSSYMLLDILRSYLITKKEFEEIHNLEL